MTRDLIFIILYGLKIFLSMWVHKMLSVYFKISETVTFRCNAQLDADKVTGFFSRVVRGIRIETNKMERLNYYMCHTGYCVASHHYQDISRASFYQEIHSRLSDNASHSYMSIK